MPQAKVRKNKPVKFTNYTDQRGVKDCLVWPDPNDKNKSRVQNEPRGDIFLPMKGEVGKPSLRGYDPVHPTVAFHVKPGADDRAIDALRGWPGNKNENGFTNFLCVTPIEQEAKQRSEKKTKGSKKRGGLEGDDVPDPLMGELISHKFLKDAVRDRELQNSKAAAAARLKAKQEYAKKFPKDIKATKASQLRSIAKAEAFHNDPKSLWQMSRFKENAEPHLDTFRHNKSNTENSDKKSRKRGNYKGTGYNEAENELFNTFTRTEEMAAGEKDSALFEINDYPEPELEFTRTSDELMGTSDDL